MSDADPILPVATYFPGRSARWIADACRDGKIPGAFKIGGPWFIHASAAAALGKASTMRTPTEADAAADLRARGIL